MSGSDSDSKSTPSTKGNARQRVSETNAPKKDARAAASNSGGQFAQIVQTTATALRTYQKEILDGSMLVGAFVVVAIAYGRTMLDLINVWDTDPNYSHGFVVPFFALGLAGVAYMRHNVAPVWNDVSRRAAIIGGIEIGVGVLLHMAAMFLGKVFLWLDVVALIFILLGILMVMGGEKANKAFGLPVFFLIFMAPLPPPVYEPVALSMQHFASVVAVNLFDVCGIPAFRSGYMIDIPGPHDMEVGAACSGLRSLTAILALAVAIAYLSGRSMLYRTVLVMFAAPVAIFINCVRVFGTGLIMMKFGPEWATGAAHEREGMVMVGVAAALLALIAWLMAGFEDWYNEDNTDTASQSKPKAVQTA